MPPYMDQSLPSPLPKTQTVAALQHSPHHLSTIGHIEMLLLQMRELEAQLLEERGRITEKEIETFVETRLERILSHPQMYNKEIFETGQMLDALKEISSRISLQVGEKAYLRLPVEWLFMQHSKKGTNYHPTRNISIPVRVEQSCYVPPDMNHKTSGGVLYLTNKRMILLEKSRLRLNVNYSQVLMRIFYQDAMEIQYHVGDTIYRSAFFIEREKIPFIEALLASL